MIESLFKPSKIWMIFWKSLFLSMKNFVLSLCPQLLFSKTISQTILKTLQWSNWKIKRSLNIQPQAFQSARTRAPQTRPEEYNQYTSVLITQVDVPLPKQTIVTFATKVDIEKANRQNSEGSELVGWVGFKWILFIQELTSVRIDIRIGLKPYLESYSHRNGPLGLECYQSLPSNCT